MARPVRIRVVHPGNKASKTPANASEIHVLALVIEPGAIDAQPVQTLLAIPFRGKEDLHGCQFDGRPICALCCAKQVKKVACL